MVTESDNHSSGGVTTDPLPEAVLKLLVESLGQWEITATAELLAGHTPLIKLVSPDRSVTVEPAPEGLPFRWFISNGVRRQSAASVVGMLRMVRRHFDQNYQAMHLRVGHHAAGPTQ